MELAQRSNGADFHNNNINNSRLSRKGSMPSANGSMVFCSANESSSASNSNHQESTNNAENLTAEEIKQQTKKVVESFLQSVIAKKEKTERVQRDSRQRSEPQRAASAPIASNLRYMTPGNRSQQPIPVPQQVPLKGSPDEMLQQVMSGVVPETFRHRSNVSIGSSDSYDSSLGKTGRFQRTKSFSKAQRHSVVTELENRGNTTPDSRRSSMDTSTPTKRSELYEAIESNGRKARSSGRHTHAISDPVAVNYDVSLKDSSETPKEEKKKGFWKNLFMSKKKSKEDIRSSTQLSHIVSEVHQRSKHSRSQGERLTTVSRESSISATRRTTPSPSSSPKPGRRTPNLIRRLSKRSKKGPKSESPVGAERSRSLEFDKLLDDDKYTSNGDTKSNSLPMSATLDTRPPHSLTRTHRKYREAEGGTAIDGHKLKPHPPNQTRRSSEDSVRPTTLEIPKKKTSKMKKLRKMMRLDSSSSSSDEAFEDSLKLSSQSLKMGGVDPVKRSSLLPERRVTQVKHSESDRPTNDSVRDRYQHRASKSMSDMDQCSEIAEKLKRLAGHYIMAQQRSNSGPIRRAETPSSFGDGKKHAGVNRAMSLTTGSSTLPTVPTHSLKTYLNLHPSNRGTKRADEGMNGSQYRQRRMFTRDQVSHGPTGSLDSPRGEITAHPANGHTVHVVNDRLLKTAASGRKETTNRPVTPPHRPPPPQVSSDSPRRHPRNSPRGPPPPPMQSSSPTLRASHIRSTARRVAADSVEPDGLATHHLSGTRHRSQHHEVHREITRTIRSNGEVRQEVEKFDEVDDVEADGFPNEVASDSIDGPPSPGLTAFHETVHRETLRTTPSGTNIREVTDEEQTITETGHTAQAQEVQVYAAADVRPRPRRRAATTPNEPTDFSDAEDGAVGGKEAEMDEDKLVARIAEELCRRGDTYNMSLDNATPALDSVIMARLGQLSSDALKTVWARVLSTVTDVSTTWPLSHPEIVQLAMIFSTAEVAIRACARPSSVAQGLISALSQNFINPIVERIGGWHEVATSIDEAERELNTYEGDEPKTSGTGSPRKTTSPDTDEELD